VLPVGVDVDAPLIEGEAHLVDSAHDDDVRGDLVDDVGILQVAADPKLIEVSLRLPDPPVAEVGTE
jgi:hypothetical protein